MVLVPLIAGIVWYVLQHNVERTEDAYVDGNVVQVTAQISGTVTAIAADNTDHVKAGAPLVTLNPVDQEVQFERARTELAKATRMARTQYSQVRQLQAEVAQLRTMSRKPRPTWRAVPGSPPAAPSRARRSAMPKTCSRTRRPP